MSLYVAYKQGVYRHETLVFGQSEKDLWLPILEYFMSTDDYHTVQVELLNTETLAVEDISEYIVVTSRGLDRKPIKREIFRVEEGSYDRELYYTRYYEWGGYICKV